MKVEYSSNNSGGSWWLRDEDWKALEAAGWTVEWVKDRKAFVDEDDRWLGALATSAISPEVATIDEAIADWSSITGQVSNDPGCECCGAPHYFSQAD